MVYIKEWADFETAATDLYAKSPLKVRYTIKFNPKTGLLVLKITDDTTCILYKSFSSIILNRFESLNLRLLSQISNVRKPRAVTPEAGDGTPSRDRDEDMGTGLGQAAGGLADKVKESVGGQVSGTSTPVKGAAGKKKKKGKK